LYPTFVAKDIMKDREGVRYTQGGIRNMKHDLSLIHLVRSPLQEQAAPPLLLLLHGVGSNERDLFSLAPQFDERLLVISARAPNTRAPDRYAWFEVTFTPQGPLINPQQAEASRLALLQFVREAVAAYCVDPRRVYLAGFSQGAIMSASVALTEPELIAGAALMSGRILPEIDPLLAEPQRLAGKPFLVVHGTADNVLPIHHGRASRDLLASLPVALTYHEYSLGHEISQQSLADVNAWLSGQLD
jgi:phospholipase/carboxylesterase